MAGTGGDWVVPTWDDDNEVEEEVETSREAVLFCIEGTPSMLDPASSNESSSMPSSTQARAGFSTPAKSKMEQALRAAYAYMLKKVISNPKDLIGLLVFGVNGSYTSPELDMENTDVLIELATPTREVLLTLRRLLRDVEKDPEWLKNVFEPLKEPDPTALSALFGQTSNLFRKRCGTSPWNKRLFLITDNDDPLASTGKNGPGLAHLIGVAKQRRADLEDVGVDLEPFFIPPREGAKFNVDKFYGPLITMEKDDASDEGSSGIPYPVASPSLADSLLSLVDALRVKDSARRTAFTIPFILNDGFVIGINGYNLIGEEKKKQPVKVNVHSATGDMLIRKTVYLNQDDQTRIEDPKKEIKKFYQIGQPLSAEEWLEEDTGPIVGTSKKAEGSPNRDDHDPAHAGHEESSKHAHPKPTVHRGPVKIFFSDEDLRALRTLGQSPNLRLLGFKPRKHFLKFQETIEHSIFIYPNEETYTGSTRTFAALLDAMVLRDVVGYGALLPRTSGKHRIVLLLPQTEQFDDNDNGKLIRPPGIHLVQLPFKDDMRDLELGETASTVLTSTNEDDDEEAGQQLALEFFKKNIIKKLNFVKYDPESLPNPVLKYWNECLAAEALRDEMPEPVDDSLPKYNIISNKLGKSIAAFKEMIDLSERDETQIRTAKRGRVDRPKKEPFDASKADTSWVVGFKRGPDKLKKDELTKICRELQVPVSGNKPQLIERIWQAIKEHDLDVKAGDDDADGGGSEEEEESRPKKSKKKQVVLQVDDDDDW